jgi:hypothetical protein
MKIVKIEIITKITKMETAISITILLFLVGLGTLPIINLIKSSKKAQNQALIKILEQLQNQPLPQEEEVVEKEKEGRGRGGGGRGGKGEREEGKGGRRSGEDGIQEGDRKRGVRN